MIISPSVQLQQIKVTSSEALKMGEDWFPRQKQRHCCWVPSHLGDGGHHLQAAELDRRRKWFAARHGISSPQARHVGTSNHQVADGQEHDGPLRVAKTRRVNQEGEHLQRVTERGEWILNINLDLIRFALINPRNALMFP